MVQDHIRVRLSVIRWLSQLTLNGWYQLESRIQELERNMVLALEEIELHNEERKLAEERHIQEMQEQMDWYQTELNLNPFSWGKGKGKK